MKEDLTKLSLGELKALRQKWYAEALENLSLTKCQIVCQWLGHRLNATYGPKYNYTSGDLFLYVDNYGGYATAAWRGKTVMSTHPCDRLFIPGEWMEIVEANYPRALKVMEENQAQDYEKERHKLLDELTLATGAPAMLPATRAPAGRATKDAVQDLFKAVCTGLHLGEGAKSEVSARSWLKNVAKVAPERIDKEPEKVLEEIRPLLVEGK